MISWEKGADARREGLRPDGDLGYNEPADGIGALDRVCAESAAAAAQLRELSDHKAYRLAGFLCRIRHRLPAAPENDPLYPVIRRLEACGGMNADTRCSRERAVRKLLEAYEGDTVLVFLETVDWDIPLFQRPQQMALAFGKLGSLFFYCTPNGRDRVGLPEHRGENCVLLPWDGAEAALRLAGEYGKKTVLGTLSTDTVHSLAEIKHLRRHADKLLYEYIDALSEEISGPIGPEIRQKHTALLRDPSVYTIATADSLYRHAIRVRGSSCRCLNTGNGADTEHFSVQSDPRRLPGGLADLLVTDKPVIGYFGALASWFDFELMAFAAKERPGYRFVLLGEPYDEESRKKAKALAGRKNIFCPGAVGYRELPYAAAFFTAAVIPFRVNEVTLATSPIKLFEYMALGKPTVTADLPECRKEPLTLIARSREEFVLLLDRAVELSRDASYGQKLRRAAAASSWGTKAGEIARFLEI